MDRKLKINKEKLIKNKSVSLSQRGAFYFILFNKNRHYKKK